MNKQIALYEELSFNSHPSLYTQYYDGWILRYANGYTNRANSVNMIYDSSIDIDIKIKECEKRYFAKSLPCVFKITDDSDKRLDSMLDEMGYKVVTPTMLMDMDLNNKSYVVDDYIITDYADDAWLNTYFSLSNYTDNVKCLTAKQIMDSVQNRAIYCRITENGKSVACASAIFEREFVTILNVIVDEKYRGRGYGRKLCEALLAKAIQFGAHTAFLQVVESNHIAKTLYEKLGFTDVYLYWYRVKEK